MSEAQEGPWAILIIDDHPLNIGFLRDALEFNGHEVKVASNGPEGLEILEGWTPDFVLLDLEMPVMSGTDVLRTIRKRESLQEVIVVIMSAHQRDEVEDKCAEVLPDEILVKPVRFGLLRQTLAGLKPTSN